MNQQDSSKFETVSVIKGKMTDGLLDGFATLITWDSETWSGNFSNGFLEGKGVCKKANGEFRDGLFINGVFIEGECFWHEKDLKHEGEFKDGYIFNGVETVYENDAILFEQYYVNGEVEKKVEAIALGEFIYLGDRNDEKANGFGKIYSKFGRLVGEGIFKDNNLISGYRFTSDNSLLRLNKLNGPAVLYTKEQILVGNFVENFLFGFGAEILSRYDLKIGKFSKNEFLEGKHWKNFTLSEGQFENGLLNGTGHVKYYFCEKEETMICSKPPQEFDEWIEQCMNGENLQEISDAMSGWESLSWEKGTFKNGLLHGQGESIIGGCRRKGTFVKGKLHGEGEKTRFLGETEKGTFVDDELIDRIIQNPKNKSLFCKSLNYIFNSRDYLDFTAEICDIVTNFKNCFEEGEYDGNKLIYGNIVVGHVPNGSIVFDIKNGNLTSNLSVKNGIYEFNLLLVEGKSIAFDNIKDNKGKSIYLDTNVDEKLMEMRLLETGCILEGSSLTAGSITVSSKISTDIYGFRKEFSVGENANLICKISFLNFKIVYNFTNNEFISAQKNEAEIAKQLPENFSGKGVFIDHNSLLSGTFKYGLLDGMGVEITIIDHLLINFKYGLFESSEITRGIKKLNDKCLIGCFENERLSGPGIVFESDFTLSVGSFTDNQSWTGYHVRHLLKQEGNFVKNALDGYGKVSTPEFEVTGKFEKGTLRELISLKGKFDKFEEVEMDLEDFKSLYPISFTIDKKYVRKIGESSKIQKEGFVVYWNWWGLSFVDVKNGGNQEGLGYRPFNVQYDWVEEEVVDK